MEGSVLNNELENVSAFLSAMLLAIRSIFPRVKARMGVSMTVTVAVAVLLIALGLFLFSQYVLFPSPVSTTTIYP
jgi:hypothetical protein